MQCHGGRDARWSMLTALAGESPHLLRIAVVSRDPAEEAIVPDQPP